VVKSGIHGDIVNMSDSKDGSTGNLTDQIFVDPDIIARMTGQEFEALIAALLCRMGFDIELTKASHDGGIDIRARCSVPFLQGVYIIQCKRYLGSVGEPFVRDLFGVVTAERANKGILVTNSAFTPSALAFAAGKPLELIDGNRLVDLLIQFKVAIGEPVTPTFDGDPEVSRLHKLVAALPDELQWRVQLAQYLLGFIRGSHKIVARDQLMKYVEDAEVQLAAINEIAQSHQSRGFEFLEHSSAYWLGMLQLYQGKLDESVKWLGELRSDRFQDKAPQYPEIIDDMYLANALSVANIADACNVPVLRQKLFRGNSRRIEALVERRKKYWAKLLRANDRDSNLHEFGLAQIKVLDGLKDNVDLLFLARSIVYDLKAIEDKNHDTPYGEICGFLMAVGSVRGSVMPELSSDLADFPSVCARLRSGVEQAMQKYLEWVENWEPWR